MYRLLLIIFFFGFILARIIVMSSAIVGSWERGAKASHNLRVVCIREL
jgi:hypothetical protein